MAEQTPQPEKTQSGLQVALGVIGFMVGLIVVLWILKLVLGM